MVLLLPPGAQGGWGARGHGRAKAYCGSTMLSASWEAAVSHAGEIESYCIDGGPAPPPAVTGFTAGSRQAGDCNGKGRQHYYFGG
jgi:hypothetical protein